MVIVLSVRIEAIPNVNQAEFQQKQGEIYSDLATALLDSIPDDWDTAVLTLGSPIVEHGKESMSHEISNPKLADGLATVMPDDSIYTHTRKLEMLFRDFGVKWKKAMFQLAWDDISENWRMVMEYEYDK